jgi:hypothetical protein
VAIRGARRYGTMRLVRRRRAQTRILATLTFLLVGAGLWVGTAATTSGNDSTRARSTAHASDPVTLYATVAAGPAGPPLPAGFLGLSLEYSAL